MAAEDLLDAAPLPQCASARREHHRMVSRLLLLLGGVDLLALIPVFMPREWIEASHVWAGLGEFPAAPIAGYLARSASVMYALHGLMIVVMARDVARYEPLIRVLAWVAVIHGGIILSIDLREGMPGWWTWLEGPCFSGTGVAVLAAQRCASPRPETIHS